MCVAVGTVFNEVLVWMVSGQQVDNRVSVAMLLKGHEVRVVYHNYILYSISLGGDIFSQVQ